jgi:orotidine-5'-phosphate decarboxylase
MIDGTKGVIILCKTSNKGSIDLQNLRLENGDFLYQHVAKMATTTWNTSGQVALVL